MNIKIKCSSVILIFALLFPLSVQAHFIDNGDGTITDIFSGFMWFKNANLANSAKTWNEAGTYVQGLNYADYNDWRLLSGQNSDGSVCNSYPTGANCAQTEFAT